MDAQPVTRYLYPHDPCTLTVGLPGRNSSHEQSLVFNFPILSNHPIVRRWDGVSQHIIRRLERADILWVTVECFQRRQTSEKSEDRDDTTVVIAVKKFPEVTYGVKKMLHEIHEDSGGLFVELSLGQIWRSKLKSTMQDRSRRLRTLRVFNSIHTPVPYPFKPPVGESVGVAGIDSSSGIFIGYLELSKEGHPIKKCGLICHHLVRPCLFGISPASHLAPITEDVGKYIKVQYPSSRDHLAELVLLDQKITHVKNLQRQHGSSKSIVERLKRYQVEKDWTISANRDIGTILASSGIAISNDENYRLDWALIDLYPGRAGTNTVKPPLFGHRETIGPQHPPVYLAREALYSELGYINPVRSCVYDRDASQGAPQETRTKEWAVVGGTTKDIIKGDPGILVRELETNKAIGVVWGGNNIMGTTYFTPLDVIAKSIREKTGYSARFLDSEEDA